MSHGSSRFRSLFHVSGRQPTFHVSRHPPNPATALLLRPEGRHYCHPISPPFFLLHRKIVDLLLPSSFLLSFLLLAFLRSSLPFIPSAKATLSRSIISGREGGENDIPKIICNPVVGSERRVRDGYGGEDATTVLGLSWDSKELHLIQS